MTKFNKPTVNTRKTHNYEGGSAYKLTPKLELYSLVCTTLLQDKFYTKSSKDFKRVKDLVQKVSPEFVAKLAIYAREKMYLRSIPMVLTVELAKIHKGTNLVSKLVKRVIQRVDEITEMLSYYQQANNRRGAKKLNKLSKQIQKGIAYSFTKFDEYQFGKYNRDNEVKLKDALFLSHAKPFNTEQKELFKKIVEDTLAVPYTWEVELSKLGQQKFEDEKAKKKAFKEKWEEIIDSKKMGYMATMRNLRNIIEAGVSTEHINNIASYLSNPVAVSKSKQLPFRFYVAYKQLMNLSSPYINSILEALNEAIWLSVDNLIGINNTDTVLVAADDSSSMEGTVLRSIKWTELGILLGVLLRKKCKHVTFGLFSDNFRVHQIPGNENVLEAVNKLMGETRPSGTQGWKVIHYANKSQYSYDKVYMFTDMQMWNISNRSYYSFNHDAGVQSEWVKYKKLHPQAELVLVDLSFMINHSLPNIPSTHVIV